MVPVATQPTANAFVLLDGQVPTATLVSTSPVLKKYSSQKQYIRFAFSFCACLRISAYVCVYVCVSLRVLNFCQRLSSCMPSCRVVCMSVYSIHLRYNCLPINIRNMPSTHPHIK